MDSYKYFPLPHCRRMQCYAYCIMLACFLFQQNHSWTFWTSMSIQPVAVHSIWELSASNSIWNTTRLILNAYWHLEIWLEVWLIIRKIIHLMLYTFLYFIHTNTTIYHPHSRPVKSNIISSWLWKNGNGVFYSNINWPPIALNNCHQDKSTLTAYGSWYKHQNPASTSQVKARFWC